MNATALTLQQDYGGRAPARSPEWAGNAGFAFNIPVGDNKVGLSDDAYYSDGYFAAETMAPSTYQSSFWRINASVKLAKSDDRWSVGLVGRNLTNKYYLLYAADRTGGASVPGAIGEQRGVVARGREVAVQARFKFWFPPGCPALHGLSTLPLTESGRLGRVRSASGLTHCRDARYRWRMP